MATPSIFISHSAGAPDEEAERVLPELARRLEGVGLDVWCDKERLRLSDFTWRREIDLALHFCRAAVILVSTRALESGWVRYEASILAHRSRLCHGFALIPVLTDGVRAECLATSSWEPIALETLQAVLADAPADSLDAVIERLAPLVQRYSPDSPEARLENLLVNRLECVGPGALEGAAHRLEIKTREWGMDLATAVARRLLEVPIETQYHALCVLADIDASGALEVYEHVAPHGWINMAAAEQIRRAARCPGGQRGLGLNAAKPLTPDMHVRCGFHAWRTCEVEGNVSADDIDELVARVRTALRDWMEPRPDPRRPPPTDEDIDKEVAESDDDLPFVVLPPDAAFPDALKEIRGLWPHLPLLLRCEDDSCERFAARGLPYIGLLDPPLVPDDEATTMTAHDKHVRRLGRRDGQRTR